MKEMNMNKCPECGSTDILDVEYDWKSADHYDGTSEFQCLKCGVRVGRWSGKVLSEGENEPRFGVRKEIS